MGPPCGLCRERKEGMWLLMGSCTNCLRDIIYRTWQKKMLRFEPKWLILLGPWLSTLTALAEDGRSVLNTHTVAPELLVPLVPKM